MHIDNENFDITCPNALLSQCLTDSYCNLTFAVPAAPPAKVLKEKYERYTWFLA